MASEDGPAETLPAAGGHARARGLALNNRLLWAGGISILAIAAAWLAGLGGLPLSLVALAAIGLVVGVDRLYSPQIDRWLQGAEGERQVGAVLDGLRNEGWRSLHDISLGRGNVDHVLIGPGGIYTIETKSHRGRISVDRIQPEMLRQAYAQKKLLERITDLEAQPLLVFSQAWLTGSVPARRKGVVVLPARMLPHYLSRRRPVLSPEEAVEIHRRLAAALADRP